MSTGTTKPAKAAKQADAPTGPYSLTIPAEKARYLAQVALAAASRDDVTPVICGGMFSASGGVVTAVATDRYRVHRARWITDGELEAVPPSFIPREALRWLVSNVAFFGRLGGFADPKVEITWTPDTEPIAAGKAPKGLKGSSIRIPAGTVTIRIPEPGGQAYLELTVQLHPGNYPPVEQLIDKALALEASAPPPSNDLNVGHLAETRVLAESRYERAVMRFVRPDPQTRPESAQLLVQFRNAVALVQMGKVQ